MRFPIFKKKDAVVKPKETKIPETAVKNADRFLIERPISSERAFDLQKHNQYVLKVKRGARKPEIKKAVESIYAVKVKGVRVINVSGKTKKLGRSIGRTSQFKKAIVTLAKGQTIEISNA